VATLNKQTGLAIAAIATTLFLLCAPVAAVLTMTTNAAAPNATNPYCIVMSGTSSEAAKVWFEFGINQTSIGNPEVNGRAFATKSRMTTGGALTYTEKICGIPLLPGKAYVYQAVGNISDGIIKKGVNISFTVAAITPHPTTTYEDYANTFVDLSSDANGGDPVSKLQELLLVNIWAVYVEVIGFGLFFGVIIGMVFVNLVIKQQTIALSVIVMLLTGGSLFLILPPEFVQLAQILMIIAIAGMMYWVVKRKR
jgi:hypothetical protein